MRNIPSDTAGKLELVKLIMERELSTLQQQTLVDYYIHGMTMEQIARERGVNASSVYRTLVRGLRTIRRFLLMDPQECKEIVNSPGKNRKKLAFPRENVIISSERMVRKSK